MLSNLYYRKSVFPVHPFDEQEYLQVLKLSGLCCLSSITAQHIVDIIDEIKVRASGKPVACNPVSYLRGEAVVMFVDCCDHQFFKNHVSYCIGQARYEDQLINALQRYAKSFSWLPVCSKRPGSHYPDAITWKGSSYGCHFASSEAQIVPVDTEMDESLLPLILGSQMLFVNGRMHSEFAQVLMPPYQDLVSAAVHHMNEIVLTYSRHEIDENDVEAMVVHIYKYLSEALDDH